MKLYKITKQSQSLLQLVSHLLFRMSIFRQPTDYANRNAHYSPEMTARSLKQFNNFAIVKDNETPFGIFYACMNR